jgi:hypothetical protein
MRQRREGAGLRLPFSVEMIPTPPVQVSPTSLLTLPVMGVFFIRQHSLEPGNTKKFMPPSMADLSKLWRRFPVLPRLQTAPIHREPSCVQHSWTEAVL